MHGELKNPIDVMAAIKDKSQRQVEAVDVRFIEVSRVLIDHDLKVAQFTLVLGGKDSGGRFHEDQTRKEKMRAVMNINSPMFEMYFQTKEGNPKWDLPESLMQMIFSEHLVLAANQLVWGMEDLEVTNGDGKTIYKKEKAK